MSESKTQCPLCHNFENHQAGCRIGTLELELNEAKKTLPLNSKLRLIDLVRYARSLLHQEELITDEEYAELCSITESPKRLVEYDQLRSQLNTAQQDLKVLTDFFDANPNHLASQLKKAQQEIAELKRDNESLLETCKRVVTQMGIRSEPHIPHYVRRDIEQQLHQAIDSAMKGTK